MGRRCDHRARMKTLLPFLCLALFLAVCLAGPAPAQDSPVFKVDVRLVRMLATVKDTAGELVGSLDARDFTITDNGVPQEITLLEHNTSQPLSITLLLDISGSTGKDLKYETASVLKFLDALVREGNPSDAVSLYTFNWQVTLLDSFTRRLNRIEDHLKFLKPEGGTSLYDAIYLAAPPLRNREGRRIFVAISDGGDTTSSKKYQDALDAAQKADAVVYPIVVVPITNPVGRNTGGEHALETLAASTGGRTFYPSVGPELDRVFAEILRDLRTQYLIGYYPQGVPTGEGKFHTVRLTVPGRQDLRISTRAGYYGDVSR
jgi:Ca-activated chloride channel homolog